VSKSPDVPKNWTIETYAAHADALRAAEHRFNDERDRRYTEVNIEKEKALKIKETADLAALSLARESQTYKEQQNDALRDKNLSESGVYATNASLSKVADDIRASTDAAIQGLATQTAKTLSDFMTEIKPFMNGSIRQEGQQTGSILTRGQIISYIALATASTRSPISSTPNKGTHMTTTTRTVTVTVLKRDWNDIEPKLLAFLATGLTATAVVSAGDYVGIHIPVGLAMLVVMVVGAVAEYIKSSTTKVSVPVDVVPATVAPAVAQTGPPLAARPEAFASLVGGAPVWPQTPEVVAPVAPVTPSV